MKQLANVRRTLNAADCFDSRLMTAAVTALRAELRQEGYDPQEITVGSRAEMG